MNQFSLSSNRDLLRFIENENFKKIFVLSGKTSYILSDAKNILASILKKKITKYYFKNSFYPEIYELKKIIYLIRKFSPDLIIAIGGGSVIDYGKLANVLEIKKNLDFQIKNSNYEAKKKIYQVTCCSNHSWNWCRSNRKFRHLY